MHDYTRGFTPAGLNMYVSYVKTRQATLGSRLFDPTTNSISHSKFRVHEFSTADKTAHQLKGWKVMNRYGHLTMAQLEWTVGMKHDEATMFGPMSCKCLNFKDAKIPWCPSQSVNPRDSRDQRFAPCGKFCDHDCHVVHRPATAFSGGVARFDGQVWTWPNYGTMVGTDKVDIPRLRNLHPPTCPVLGFMLVNEKIDPLIIPLVLKSHCPFDRGSCMKLYVPFLFQQAPLIIIFPS
jgi:hypothetical protein